MTNICEDVEKREHLWECKLVQDDIEASQKIKSRIMIQ
jgi:hypothetical protein